MVRWKNHGSNFGGERDKDERLQAQSFDGNRGKAMIKRIAECFDPADFKNNCGGGRFKSEIARF